MNTDDAHSNVRAFGRWGQSAKEREMPTERPVSADVQLHTPSVDIVGHVDLCGRDLVEGWVFWRSQPDRKLQLDIVIAGELLGQCNANLFRPDLQKAGYGDGHCAFSFRIPRAFSVHDFASTRLRLVNSTLYLLPDETTILWRPGA